MTLGIALLLIFILYLIDKHSRWRQAVKITIGLIVVGLVGLGGIYAWQKYDDYQTEKQNLAYRAKMQPVWDCESRNAQFSNAAEECEKDPSVVLHATKDIFEVVAPDQSSGPAPNSKIHSVLGSAVVTSDSTNIDKRCYFNTGSFPCGIESYNSDGEVVATLHKGDRVQLLSNETRASGGSEIYEVKFQQWTGWVVAANLSLANAEEK
jgi:hypothetical protein